MFLSSMEFAVAELENTETGSSGSTTFVVVNLPELSVSQVDEQSV